MRQRRRDLLRYILLTAIACSFSTPLSRAEDVPGNFCLQQVVRVQWGGLIPAIPGLRGLRPGEMVQLAEFVNLTDRPLTLQLRLRYRGAYDVLGSFSSDEGREVSQVDEEVTGIVKLQPSEQAKNYPIHLKNIFHPAPEPETAVRWISQQEFRPEVIYPQTSCYLETAAFRQSEPPRELGEGRASARSGSSSSPDKPPAPIQEATVRPYDAQRQDGQLGNVDEARKAIIKTKFGRIEIAFFPNKAPNHVRNFIKLAKSGFYDGTIFHRVIPGFMIQGGDPNTKNSVRTETYGQGGPRDDKGNPVLLKAEFTNTPHRRGILSMARASDPDSAGSQFFIVAETSSFLDGKYTVFGEVVRGIEVVDKIVNLPRNARDLPDERVEMTVTVE